MIGIGIPNSQSRIPRPIETSDELRADRIRVPLTSPTVFGSKPIIRNDKQRRRGDFSGGRNVATGQRPSLAA